MDDTKTALREKELLLHEIHHRTKNNLQIVSSLLSLQAKTSTNQDVKLLVRQSQDRLNAMAMIHARLAQSHDATRVDFSEYLNGLVGDLARSYATGDVQIRVEADRTELDAEIAMSCGLIINELVTNACKYAFPDGRSGEVVVRFHSPGDGRHELIVTDNGVGMKKDAGGQRSHSLGFQLVETLVEQIGGRMEVSTEGGSSFLIQFAH